MNLDLTHAQLAQQANAFTLALLAPVPFATAVTAVSLREGSAKEALWQGWSDEEQALQIGSSW